MFYDELHEFFLSKLTDMYFFIDELLFMFRFRPV